MMTQTETRADSPWRRVLAVSVCFAPLCLFAAEAAAKSRATEALDLEPTLRAAALVLAARVERVEEVPIVYGGKGVQTLHQYVFTPTQILKGVYSRPELVLTSADLQAYPGSFDTREIRTGEHRLLLLRRSRVGYINAHHVESAELAFPVLHYGGDALLEAVEVLLGLLDLNDRLEIVTRLSRHLTDAESRGAVVLLGALDRRAYIAAQHFPAIETIARQLDSDSAIAREAAADVMASLLQADYREDPASSRLAVAALAAALERSDSTLAPKTAALHAMSQAVDAVRANADAMRLVDFEAPYETLAELSGRLDVLGRLYESRNDFDSLEDFLADLELDAPHALQQSASRAWARIAGVAAVELLFDRIGRKQALGLSSIAEIEALGLVIAGAVDPWPLQRDLLDPGFGIAEQVAFVQACEANPAPQLVPALGGMLDPREQRLRRLASELLMDIDTEAAAEVLRPHLPEERDLAYKLRVSAFLGRHGFDDGYPYALEHMSEPHHLEPAVQALADIGKPGSIDQLRDIYANSNDLDWQRAAVRALGLLGDEPFLSELVELSRDLSHPLAPAALVARADLGDAAVVELLPTALSSRNEELLVAGAKAAASLLARQAHDGAEVGEALAALARDPKAAYAARRQALEALVTTDNAMLDEVLVAMIRDIRIERSDFLERVRELLRERSVVIQ